MTVIAMSRKEIDRMQVLRELQAKRITVSEAAQLMRPSRRRARPHSPISGKSLEYWNSGRHCSSSD